MNMLMNTLISLSILLKFLSYGEKYKIYEVSGHLKRALYSVYLYSLVRDSELGYVANSFFQNISKNMTWEEDRTYMYNEAMERHVRFKH